ncbi:hypothetical protein L1987_35076 [Smallanthus sonchifolius]|uniref:Uncharacterized protein n=1 Tax=Smallanthus sonchifolius TaxID=185202 RepID=A0ACB9HWS6_9ASTR|nr:hypothetical protein L1987_35076 [Smallanthus sonchifolius]
MVFCECGKEAIILTSWTSRNPGRRFYACPDRGSKCRFIRWFDHKKCQRCIDIIPDLLRAKNNLEETKNNLEVKVKAEEDKVAKLKKILIYSWICFMIYVIFF